MIKRIVIIFAAVAVLGGGGFGAFKAFVSGSTEPPAPVETQPVSTERIIEKIVCLGAVEPELFTDIKSEVSGRVAKVAVLSGERVERGDVLIELDRSELESELAEAQLEIEGSRLRMEKVKLDYLAKKELADKDFVSQRELGDAQIDLQLAENQLEIERAGVQTLQEKLAKTVLRAPHDGVVLSNDILEGMVISGATSVSEGTLLMQVAQLQRLRVNTSVNEIDVAKLRPDMPVAVKFDSIPDAEVEGRITYISPSAEAESSRDLQGPKVFPIIVTFETDNPMIRPGISAGVDIVLSEASDVLAAALPGLFLEDGEPVVYVEHEGGRFERRPVVTGISDSEFVEIKAGLAAGEKIAMSKPDLGGAVSS